MILEPFFKIKNIYKIKLCDLATIAGSATQIFFKNQPLNCAAYYFFKTFYPVAFFLLN